MPRLAVVSQNVVRGDGQGRVAMEISRRALAEGWDVDVISNKMDDELKALGARHVELTLSGPSRKVMLFKVLEMGFKADRYLRGREQDYDIILGYGYSLTRPHDLNNVQFCHSAWFHCSAFRSHDEGILRSSYHFIYTRLNMFLERKALKNARRIVACSNRTASEVVSLGFPENIVSAIHNGADPKDFSVDPAKSRAELGFADKGVIAFFAGDIRSNRKNLDTVLRALVKTPDIYLVVAGNSDGSPYPELANELGIADQVEFLGFRADIHDIMSVSDFFVFPSRYEPFGMVAVEAAFCGVPTILSRAVGANEAIGDGAIAIEDSEDVEALANAMRQLASDPSLRESMRQKSLKTRDTCSWEHITDRWMSLLNEILERKN